MKHYLSVLVIFLLVAVVNRSLIYATNSSENPFVLIANSVNHGAHDTYMFLKQRSLVDNILYSPLVYNLVIVRHVFQLVGQYNTELKRNLKLPNDENEIKQVYYSYLKNFAEVKRSGLAIRSYYFPNISFYLPEFLNTMKNYFCYTVKEFNFYGYHNKVMAVNKLNEMVKKEWKNRFVSNFIELEDIASNDTSVGCEGIVMAFDEDWKIPFDEVDTFVGSFRGLDRKDYEVEYLVHRNIRYRYDEEYKAHIIEIPLQNPEYTFDVILPLDVYGVHRIEAQFIYARATRKETFPFMNALKGFQEVKRIFVIPKFSMKINVEVSAIFKATGLGQSWRFDKDFSKCTNNNIVMGKGLHVVTIRVDNNSVSIPQVLNKIELLNTNDWCYEDEIVASHSFLFALLHRKHDIPITIGRFSYPNPTEVSSF